MHENKNSVQENKNSVQQNENNQVVLKPWSKNELENYDDYEDHEVLKLSGLESFFGGIWNRMVFELRYIILFGFLIWTVLAVSTSMNIKAQSKSEQ